MLNGRKTALVTGSTSGIGQGIAETLAAGGANIILNGFGRADDIEALRAKIEKDHGVAVRYDGADMSKPAAIEAMVKKAISEFGAVDVLVNNAGIGCSLAVVRALVVCVALGLAQAACISLTFDDRPPARYPTLLVEHDLNVELDTCSLELGTRLFACRASASPRSRPASW